MTELPRTLSRLPAPPAQRGGIGHPKPMQLVSRFVAQPVQRLALPAHRALATFKRGNQKHILLQARHHRDVPGFAKLLFGARLNVAHIRHDDVRVPVPAALAVNHTRLEKAAFAIIGGRNPGDQRHQQDSPPILPQPQPERVLLITDKETALPAFERSSSKRGSQRRILSGCFFLCPEQAASKSVASIRATDTPWPASLGSKGSKSRSLIWRNPLTPTRSRNWLSIQTSGMAWRLERWAKRRQARCSASSRTNWLKECTGVKTLNRWMRYSWAGLNCCRRPRSLGRGIKSLMKVSGTYVERSVKSWAVPVAGKFESIGLRATPNKPLRPLFLNTSHLFVAKRLFIKPYVEFPNTLFKENV
jgi:hypothetical protein